MKASEIEALLNEQPKSQGYGLVDYLAPLARGATFGFGDEISATIAAIPASFAADTSIADAYQDIHADISRQQKQFSEDNPGISLAGDIVGGIAAGGILGKLLAGPAPSLKRLAGVGALEAGTAGAGYADPGSRLKDAGIGAAIGAVGAPLMGAIGNKISEFASRNDPKIKAGRQLQQAMDADEITSEDVKNVLEADPGNLLVDVSPNLMGKGRAIATTPGPGKKIAEEALTSRQMAQQQRITDSLQKQTGGRFDFYQQADELAMNKQRQAAPLYDQAHNSIIELSDSMKNMVDDPDMASAWKRANRLFRLENGVEPNPGELNKLKIWDYFKQSLDDEIGSAYRQGHNNLGKALREKKTALLNQLDDQVPTYSEARNIFSTSSGMEDALKMGRKVLTTDADLPDIKKLTDSEKEMFINGAARAIMDKVTSGPSTANQARNLIKSPRVKERLRNAFPDDDSFNSFIKEMDILTEQGTTYSSIMGGSRTAPLQAEVENINMGEGLGVASDLVQGNFGQAAKGLASKMASNKGRTIDPRISQELAPVLFGRDIDALEALLRTNVGANQSLIQSLLGGIITGSQGF